MNNVLYSMKRVDYLYRKLKAGSFILNCAFFLLGIYGCKHDPGLLPDAPIPVARLNILSPLPGSVYAQGDSVDIIANAVSTGEFHGYQLDIKKLNDTAVYYTEFVDQHVDSISIHRKWKNTPSAPANLEVVISLELDHDGRTLVKRVSFKTQ